MKTTGKVLLSLCLTLIFILLPLQTNRAAGGVTVNLAFREASAQQGEVVTLNVSFSTFPSITRFGPIEVGYDAGALELQDVTIGRDLHGFKLDYEMAESGAAVVFSAVNEKEEESILQNSTGENTDQTTPGTPTTNVFSSDSSVVVASIRFLVKPEARGEVKAWLGSISGLRDSALERCKLSSSLSLPLRGR